MPPSSTGTEIDADRNSNLDESSTVATSFSIAIGHSHQRFNNEDSNESDAPRSHSMVVDSQFQRIVTVRQGEDRTDQRDSSGDSSRNQKCRRSRAKRSNNAGENRREDHSTEVNYNKLPLKTICVFFFGISRRAMLCF